MQVGLPTGTGCTPADYAMIGMKAGMPNRYLHLGGWFAYPDLYEETPDTLTTLSREFDEFNLIWDSPWIDNGSYK